MTGVSGVRRLCAVVVVAALLATETACGPTEPRLPDVAPYLYFGEIDTLEGLDAKLDDHGVPVLRYGEDGPWTHNPVTIAQWGLAEGSRGDTEALLHAADWLVDNQEPDGSWIYDFEYHIPSADQTLEPGWTSAMAQGNALSVLARAWDATRREAYRDAGDAALEPIGRPVSDGGLRRVWRGHVWYEEYPTEKPSLVLNGFLFTLVGIREYGDATGSAVADGLWAEGEPSAAALIDDFDLGGSDSAYALAFKDRDVELFPATGVYPRIHVELAEEMRQLTGRRVYGQMAANWAPAVTGG